MKNIWKLLMIAMLAITMVGCPADKGSDDDDDNNGGSGASGGSVWSVTGKLADIKTEWGGSAENPGFSIFLCDDTGVAAMAAGVLVGEDGNAAPQNMPQGSPLYQLEMKGDMSFVTSGVTGANAVFDKKYGDFDSETYWYDGVAVVIDGENYTLYVDMAQINKDQIYGLGADFTSDKPNEGKPNPDDVDLDGFFPCTMALNPAGGAYTSIGEFWGSAAVKMSNTGTFPATVGKPTLAAAKTLADIDIICGSISGWNPETAFDLVDGVYTYDLSDATEDADIQFVFLVKGQAWDIKGGMGDDQGKYAANGDPTEPNLEVDTKTELKGGHNIRVVLGKGKKWDIKYEFTENKPYVTITEHEDANP